MNAVLRDADVVIVGGDAIGLLFAPRAAQRFMQGVLVRDGSEVLDDGVLSLGDETRRILGAAGLDAALRLVMDAATAGVRRSTLVSTRSPG